MTIRSLVRVARISGLDDPRFTSLLRQILKLDYLSLSLPPNVEQVIVLTRVGVDGGRNEKRICKEALENGGVRHGR